MEYAMGGSLDKIIEEHKNNKKEIPRDKITDWVL
jgi:hypothetical protein